MESTNVKETIGFIGGGKMAKALVNGFITAGVAPATNITVSNRSAPALEPLKAIGVTTTLVNSEVVQQCDVIFLAVKPYQVKAVLQEVTSSVRSERHVVVSIVAGVTLKALEEILPPGTRVVRVVPNLPTLVQAGAAVVSAGTHALTADVQLVQTLLSSAGICKEGAESLLDAVTGVSGSGPAYAFAAIEALADGGVKMGLQRDLALTLAAQTLMGAAKMVLETGKHPGQLKDEVCSPGGTTIAAMAVLERRGFRSALIDAVEASTARARELGASK